MSEILLKEKYNSKLPLLDKCCTSYEIYRNQSMYFCTLNSFFSWDDMWTNCSKMCIYNRCAQHRNDSNAQVNHKLARTRNFVGHRCFNKTLNATDFCVYTLCMMIFNDIDIKWLTVEFKNHIFQLSKFIIDIPVIAREYKY